MKNKGVSLIVLIITIVVIIILATAIIVNIAKTNIIDNANEAVVKKDFKTFQDELTLYAADKYTETKGKFEIEKLNADSTSVTYTGEGAIIETNVYEIVTSLENSKYKEYVIIKDGKIAILDTMPEKERNWAKQAIGEIEVVEGTEEKPGEKNDETAPTVPTNLELTVKGNEITAVASGSTDENKITYEYSLDGTTWQETGIFENLENQTSYTIHARAKDEAGNISDVIEKEETTKYSKSSVNAKVQTRNATITGENPSYSNPVIPVGFKAIETTDATWVDSDNDGKPDGWNNGLVIQDDNLNEFVWVPCTLGGRDGTIIYTKNITYTSNYGATSENTTDDTETLSIDNNIIAENNQIKNYGGFFVGRYEAGVPANQTTIDGNFGNDQTSKSDVIGTPVVKKGATVWTNISYDRAMPNAKKLYVNSESVKSSLLTGTQWDTLCSWISSEVDSKNNSIYNITNSTNWGNYNDDPVDGDSGKKVTGFKEEWKAKNIYDLAGNAWEWTGEKRSDSEYTSYRILRGGNGNFSGSTRPVSYRLGIDSSYTSDFVSFRIMLYII